MSEIATSSLDTGNILPDHNQQHWDEVLLKQYAIGLPQEAVEATAMLMTAMEDHTSSDKTRADTYLDALAEQQNTGIEFKGFENDEDFTDLPAQLEIILGKELLDKCLVGRITYYPDIVLIAIEGRHYAIPPSEYVPLARSHPQVATQRFRAIGTSNINRHPAMQQYRRTPIAIYSFDNEPLDNKDYLPDGTEAAKKRAYKIGTVVHEVAHHIWTNVLTDDQRSTWHEINRNADPLTAYAATYIEKVAWDTEQFSEAVRVATTNPSYFNEKFSEVERFITAIITHNSSSKANS